MDAVEIVKAVVAIGTVLHIGVYENVFICEFSMDEVLKLLKGFYGSRGTFEPPAIWEATTTTGGRGSEKGGKS